MKKKIVSLLTVGLTVSTLFGCGGKKNRAEGSLAILAYNGGYGIEWLEDICAEFENQTGISCFPETDATILQKMENQLTGPTSEYDVFMSHDLNWQNYASRGLITNLDDLYETENDDGVKFKDRFTNGADELSRYKGNDGQEHYYKVAFTQGAGGLVYNASMFKNKGWTVPTTYDELVTLCAKIVKDTNGSVKPFAWAGGGGGETRDYYWDYLIYEWWGEMDGAPSIEKWLEFKGEDGTYLSGYDNFDPDGKFKNFKKAYGMWYDLVALHPEYSIENAAGSSLLDAQSAFFEQEAAMIPYGQWAKKEIEMAMAEDFEFDVKFMRTPRVSKDSKYYNFMVGFGDSMIIPENSPNKDAAKQFLEFMASDYACKAFVEKAEGPFLSFDYSDIDMSDLRKDPYIDSMYEIITDSVNFSTATNSPIVVNNSGTEIQPWIANTRYYVDAVGNASENTPDIVFKEVYNTAKEKWPTYCRIAGVQ